MPDPKQGLARGRGFVALAPRVARDDPPQSIKGVYRSKIDESWASVRVQPEDEGKPFVVFTHKDGESWRAEKSVRADEPNYAKNDVVPLSGVPKDLIEYLYAENVFAAEGPEPKDEKLDLDDLPDAGPAEFSSTDTVMDGVPESDRERVQKVLEGARQEIEDYNGVAGLYVWDLEGDSGYGIRPDEPFFAASTIKIPIMVAVYRKVDEGELEFSQEVEIQEEDWAAGAGWLQWGEGGDQADRGGPAALDDDPIRQRRRQRPGAHRGGADHVNEVARSMGAEDTVLYQKVSSERGVVPALDNRSTPRDMATMMRQIAEGKAASEKSCGYMIDLMHEDKLDWWLDAGLPRAWMRRTRPAGSTGSTMRRGSSRATTAATS